MKLKEGMYVRTKKGKIGKIVDINLGQEQERYILDSSNVYIYDKEDIIKASNNIIDLIEVGDYVNGYPVDYITNLGKEFGKRISFGDETCVVASKFSFDKVYIYEEDIKSIVTKEQFESMQYKVGE